MKRLFKTSQGLNRFMLEHVKPGKVAHVLVIHENDCTEDRCVCVPGRQWVEITVDDPDNPAELEQAIVNGSREDAAWRKAQRS